MKRGYLYIVLTAIIFSTIEISGKLIGKEVNPYSVTFLRFLIGAIILLPFMLYDMKKKKLKLTVRDFLYFIVTGTLCIPISMALLQLSVTYTKASTAAVVFSTNPVFTIPIAYFVLKEKVTKETLYSILLSIFGVICIFNPLKIFSSFKGGFSRDIMGMGIAVVAAITFSIYTVLSKKRISRYGGFIFNCMTFIFGDIVLFIIMMIFKLPIVKGINSFNLPIIIYMGIVVTGLGYIVYLAAMEKTSAVTVSMVFLIKPALAPILSLLVLKETILPNVIFGMMLIVAGSYIGFRSKKNFNVKEGY